jgi:hypothetical protein
LLEKIIAFNPKNRLTAEEVLEHEYPKSMKDEGVMDPVFKGPVDFDFD